jgi:hypothetical protein
MAVSMQLDQILIASIVSDLPKKLNANLVVLSAGNLGQQLPQTFLIGGATSVIAPIALYCYLISSSVSNRCVAAS